MTNRVFILPDSILHWAQSTPGALSVKRRAENVFGHTPLKLLWSAELHHPNKSWTFPAEGWKLEIEPAHWIVHGFLRWQFLRAKL